MQEDPLVLEFINRDVNALSNPELGSKNFNQIKQMFVELRDMLSELVQISYHTKLPGGLVGQAKDFIRQWNAFHKQMQEYNLDADARSEFRGRQNLISQIEQWYDACFSGYDTRNSKPNNFLGVFNSIKSFNLKDIELERKKLNELVAEIQTKKLSVDTITDELRKRSAGQTVSDYSSIFKVQSEKHSSLTLSWKQLRIGSAEIWLVVGILLIGAFATLLTTGKINDILRMEPTSSNTGIMLINLLTRLIVISIWIYGISFCLRQFSINKHLATLNRHRSNTLNSFKLFIESIDPSDSVTKNTLMLEVAKAIYEHGHTGHLSTKNSDTSPSIIELTRFVNQTGK